MSRDARRRNAKAPSPPEPTSQGDGQGASEPLAATMLSGVARPDATSVSPAAPRVASAPNSGAAAAVPVNRIRAVWQGAQRFDTGREGGPVARLDGANETGQSPVDALLSALATCSGVDVIEILAKRRTPAERCVIDVAATRRAESPRRVLRFDIGYQIDGAGIERQQAERAIGLAIEKYCTVAATLKQDIVIETTLTLNGEMGTAVRQPVPG